jgi:hypothetical protein
MQACALPWKTIFVAASTAQLCLTVRAMWFSCTATKGCSKCRWGSANVCTGDWKKICLVTAEAFSDGWSPPPAAVLVAGSFEVARSSVFSRPELRSEHAQPGVGVPPDMLVIVSGDGKTFHAAGCPFIHDKAHLQIIQAREALRQGYVPCVRCMKKYLST